MQGEERGITAIEMPRGDQGELGGEAKKCGAESGDPNLRFQPRLPGSVVGEASMRQVEEADKITRVTVP